MFLVVFVFVFLFLFFCFCVFVCLCVCVLFLCVFMLLCVVVFCVGLCVSYLRVCMCVLLCVCVCLCVCMCACACRHVCVLCVVCVFGCVCCGVLLCVCAMLRCVYVWCLCMCGGLALLSRGGTTRGCPFAAITVAMSLRSLTTTLGDICDHVLYADDVTCTENLTTLWSWLYVLLEHVQTHGYYPTPATPLLLVKPYRYAYSTRIFEGTGIHITIDDQRHLGATI